MKICAIFYFLLWSVLSNAQEEAAQSLKMPDWLEPENSAFSIDNFLVRYENEVADRLLPMLGEYVDIRVVVLPSFAPEWGLSVQAESGEIIFAIADKQIISGRGKTKTNVKVEKLSLPVSTAKALIRLVNFHLARVTYPPTNMVGLDGEYYHFTGIDRENHIIRAGQTWSPEDGTPVSRLVDIVWLLRDMAGKKAERDAMLSVLKSKMKAAEIDFE